MRWPASAIRGAAPAGSRSSSSRHWRWSRPGRWRLPVNPRATAASRTPAARESKLSAPPGRRSRRCWTGTPLRHLSDIGMATEITEQSMRRPKDGFVSANELARIAYCERQVAFDAAHGRRSTKPQDRARQRGLKAYAAFYEESRRIADASAVKGRPDQQDASATRTACIGHGPACDAARPSRPRTLRRSNLRLNRYCT